MIHPPETPVLYLPTNTVALTRHSFHSRTPPEQDLVELYRHGPHNHYIGFVDSSQVVAL